MRVAPAMRAPCTIAMPIRPRRPRAPSRLRERAVLSTAPTPVCTAQPITHDLERRVVGNLDRTRHRRDHELREPGEPDAAQHGRAVTRERRAPVHQRSRHDRGVVDATAVLAAHAPVARVARGDRREHDLVADRELGHPGADRLDRARGLVAEHGRRRHRERAVGEREVGVADAAVAHPHEHLARTRIFDVDVVDDFERLLGCFEQAAHGEDASFTAVRATRGNRAWTSSTSG